MYANPCVRIYKGLKSVTIDFYNECQKHRVKEESISPLLLYYI